MLSQKTLASVAALLKIKPEDVKAAIDDKEEKELTIEDGLLSFTKTELETRDTNIKDSGKSGHYTAAREVLIKEMKAKAGVEFDGKDPEKFLEKLQEKILRDAKIAPDTKVQELTTQIQTLRTTLEQKEAEVKTANASASGAKLDARILSSLPANRNPAFSDQDYLLLIKNRLKIEDLDGKEVVRDSKGEVIRDNKALPKDLTTVIGETFTATTGWTAPEGGKGGRGGGSSSPAAGGAGGKPVSYSEAVKAWEADGKSINSSDFATHLNSLKTENKEFVWDAPGTSQAETK